MSFTCPECGTRQHGGTPGAVVACATCRNPVVVPPPPPPAAPRPPAPRAAEVGAAVTPGGANRLWGTAALVLVIVAAGHAGLYLLLTHEARGARRTLEAEHGAEALRAAKRPEDAPQPGTPVYATWRRDVERHDAAEAWRRHGKHVGLLRSGFLASFLVQVAITLWILMKVLGKQKRRDAAARA